MTEDAGIVTKISPQSVEKNLAAINPLTDALVAP